MANPSETLCVTCEMPLIVEIEDEQEEDEVMVGTSSGSSQIIDDDVTMSCGCHFHWQCLLDAYTITECPHCKSKLSTRTPDGSEQILCTLKNEGGVQEDLDILPILTEETYLKAFPEERKGRAFLEFCASGDVQAILEMAEDGEGAHKDDEVTSDPADVPMVQVLRYQDHVASLNSGLHLAIVNDRIEVAWLLLLLASELDDSSFPAEALAAAANVGVQRGDFSEGQDIRVLKNAEGLIPAELAESKGGMWLGWVQKGILIAR